MYKQGRTPASLFNYVSRCSSGLFPHIHTFYQTEPTLFYCPLCCQYLKISATLLPSQFYYFYLEPGNVLKVNCSNSSSNVEFEFVPAILQQATLKLLRHYKPDDYSFGLYLFTLRIYLTNLLKGNIQPINTNNANYQKRIGNHQSTNILFEQCGYALNEGFWYPTQIQKSQIELILKEIYVQVGLLKHILQADVASPVNANETILRMLGSDYKKRNIPYQDTSKPFSPSYEGLGVLPDMPDEYIILAFQSAMRDNSERTPKLLDCLIDLARGRQSSALEEHIQITRSQGYFSEQEITSAFVAFGTNDQSISDETLIGIFNMLCSEEPKKRQDFIDALKTIARYRNSPTLLHFFNMGDVVNLEVFHQQPVGLDNIGNTCYLNSLLQYFFTVSDLRERIFAFKVADDTPDAIVNDFTWKQVIDGEKISLHDYTKAIKFVSLLQELYNSMLTTYANTLSPPQKLAEMALGANLIKEQANPTLLDCPVQDPIVILESLGAQQDVTECMDNLLRNMQIAFSKEGEEEDVIKSDSIVDVEGVKGALSVALETLPPVLTFQIQRVAFDVKEQRTIKSNDYVGFDPIIYLALYTKAGKAEFTKAFDRIQSLRSELKEIGDRIVELEKKLSNADTENPNVDLINFDSSQPIDKESVRISIDTLKRNVENKKSQLLAIYHVSRNQEYRVHAVFIHSGDASYGHYWVYLFDHKEQQWYKMNDSYVSKVEESEIFSANKDSSANSYLLVYVRTDSNIL